MKAAALFVRCLEAEGVEFIFGLAGEENLELLDALADSPIRYIPVRHEQAAAFMADVYGRLTGKAGVCLSTLGPGAANLVTGVAVCGDGGFLMNSQELETAVRLGVNPVIVIFNDGGFGLIQAKQMEKFGRPFGVHFGNPDFVAFAESFGVKGYRVEAADDFRKILPEALARKTPSIIEIPIDGQEHTRLMKELGHSI